MKVTDNEGNMREVICPKCLSPEIKEYQTIARRCDGYQWECKKCGKLFDA